MLYRMARQVTDNNVFPTSANKPNKVDRCPAELLAVCSIALCGQVLNDNAAAPFATRVQLVDRRLQAIGIEGARFVCVVHSRVRHCRCPRSTATSQAQGIFRQHPHVACKSVHPGNKGWH